VSEVIILLGSPSDAAWGKRIAEALDAFGVSSHTRIGSAHKTPHHLLHVLAEREARGGCVYVTVAGRSNALSGFVDAAVSAPVIACPPLSDTFGGMDVISSLRMPSGVAPLLVLEPENAALAAAKILALADPALRERIERFQQAGRQRVIDADAAVHLEQPVLPGTVS
jgi:5-(carboxyamino)imidazole ribonucleotide mutase